MRSIYAIILAILLLATGCSDSYCPSLDKVVTVEESDFYEISLSGLKPREIDLDLMGIIGARYCDSLLVVTTLGTDRLLHLYDRHCLLNFSLSCTQKSQISENKPQKYCTCQYL